MSMNDLETIGAKPRRCKGVSRPELYLNIIAFANWLYLELRELDTQRNQMQRGKIRTVGNKMRHRIDRLIEHCHHLCSDASTLRSYFVEDLEEPDCTSMQAIEELLVSEMEK